jgi:pyruvate formate lyase activating enzyme
MHAYIFNIQGFSIHDGPGIRTTVFFQGCPLQCIWCQNPEGIPQLLDKPDGQPEHAGIRKYTVDQLMEEVMKDRAFYEESGGGVTFSGGEPLMQTAFLIEMLNALKKENIHTAIDTSGYAPEAIFREVVNLADMVLFDIKIIDNSKHELYTGTGNKLIHNNLKYIANSGIPFRIRIPLVNKITAEEENLMQIANLLTAYKNVEIDLLSYHDLARGKQEKLGVKQKKLTAPEGAKTEKIRQLFASRGFKVNIGG